MPALPSKMQRAANVMSVRLASKSGTLPSPQQWRAWHSNVKTPDRANGTSGLLETCSGITIHLEPEGHSSLVLRFC